MSGPGVGCRMVESFWRVWTLFGSIIIYPVSKMAGENTMEKNLAERKKKAIAEKKRLEEEIEELKSQHEEEISSLKEKLRKQKSSIDATASEQVAEAEEELTKEWKDKCDRLLASAQEKHQRALSDLEEEKQRVEEQLTDMEKKVADAKAAKGSTNKQVEQLQEEVDSLKAWKDKYEQVRTQAATMKERYEDRISDLEEEKEKIIAEAQEAINRLRQGGAGGGGKDAVVGEVKKIMNTVYHELKGEFAADKSYKGSDIHGVILNTVKSTTMKMVRAQEEEESSGPVEEKMEVAGAASTVSAPPTTGGKKADKPTGGFSLGGLESSIITGDTIPTSDKNKAKSPDAKKQKKDSETVPVVAMVTGDKGNPYYAAELKKAAEEAKKEKGKLDLKAEKPAAGKDKGQKSPVEPVAAPITGDKGNPYYAEELRKAAEKAKATVSPVKEEVQAPVMAMTTSAPPPAKGAKDKVEKPVSVQTTSAPTPGKPKEKEVSAGVCGDKGNPYYAEELRKAAEEAKKTVEKGGKDLSAHVASVTGDKGNPYYAAELMGKTLEHKTPEQPKRSEAEVLAGIEASMLAVTGIMAGAKKDDPQTKKEKDSDNKNQKEKKEDKKDDKGKAKADGDKKKSTEKSLFDDDDDEDLFAAAKPAKKDATPAGDKKTDKKTDAKKAAPAKDAKKGSDSEDDLRKPPPPPLFGEEEDDDDWLS